MSLSENKVMNWDEIVKAFPDKWVALTDYKLTRSSDIQGIVKAACTEDKMDDYDKALSKDNKKVLWIRTSEIGGNMLWVN